MMWIYGHTAPVNHWKLLQGLHQGILSWQLQSMHEKNYCNGINSHVRPCQHEQLFLIIWNCAVRSKICVSEIQSFLLLKYVQYLTVDKYDKAQLWKQKVTITSVAVVTMKLPFGMCDWTVHSYVGTGDWAGDIGCACPRTRDRTCLWVWTWQVASLSIKGKAKSNVDGKKNEKIDRKADKQKDRKILRKGINRKVGRRTYGKAEKQTDGEAGR